MQTKKAFSLIELLMVMAVGLSLTIMAIPAFTKIARKSKVQQAAETLVAALNNAATMSKQGTRNESVVVYFGDDFSTVRSKPPVYINAQFPGCLPKYGNIEIWSAKASAACIADSYAKGWAYDFPLDTPLEPLSVESYTFPEGVRILAGNCRSMGTPATPAYDFYFTLYSRESSYSELKRHYIRYSGGSGSAYDGSSGYEDVLVFDVVTGEYLVINATPPANEVSWDPKPRIRTNSKTHENLQLYQIVNPAVRSNNVWAAGTPLTNKKDLPKIMDQYSGL